MSRSQVLDESRAFETLAQFLQHARNTQGLFSIPPALHKAVEKRFLSGSEISRLEVEAVIKALDDEDSAFHKCLNAGTLSIVCGLLRLSASCEAQVRGFFLLTECLHEDPTQAFQKDSTKKTEVGKVIMTWAIRRFLELNRPSEYRKALGSLALELLVGNNGNAALLTATSQEGTWSDSPQRDIDSLPDATSFGLGECAIRDGHEIHKIIAGSIIRELQSHGMSIESFWPDGKESQRSAAFPKSQYHTSQWVFDFASFVDKQRPESPTREQSEVKVFAAAFVLGEILYTIEGASAILVVIGEQLSLAMLSTTTDPSLYLDIPFGSVQDVEVSDTQSQSLSQMRGSQKPVQYCLKLNLRLTKANNYRLNAKSSSVDSITIVFDHPKDSRLVEDALSEYCELPQKGLLDRRMFGHTMPLDISLKQSLDSERDTYDTEALTYIASDAVDAMDEAQSNLEESAADAGTLNGHLHGRNPQSREEVSTISQTFKRDLPTNSTRLTTSHSGGRALVSRDYVDVSTHAQTMEDTSSSADEDNAVMQPKTLNTLGHSTDDAADIAHSNGDQRRGQLVAMRSSSDPLNTISPKRSTMNQESHRDPESLTGHTSMKQLHSQSHVADPKRPKLTQTMRDANGQSVAGVGEVTPKGSQVGYGRNNAERPPGRTKAGSVISKTARPEAQSRDEVAVHKKGLTATRKRVSPVQNQEEGVAKDRRIAKEARDHPGRTVAQGSSSQRLKIAVAPKPITTNTSSKKVAPSILPPKPQGKGKVPEVRKEKPTRDGVNYDEAFEVDNGAESSGDESNNKKTKAQKQQKASANQKKVKKPAAKKAPPTKKTQNIPPATRKPQRRAAVKANKAIQGIVEDDTAEQPNFEALIHLSPTAQRIPKDGQATTGDKKSGMRPPPINALSPPIRPAMTTPAVPKDRQGPSFTKQSPEQSLLYPAEVIDTVNFKTKPTVGPFIVDSTGETEHASSNSPPDAALEDPTKVVPSTLEMNTPLATNEDVYEVADSFPDKALATGSSQNPSLETAAPIQGMQPNHDQVPAKNTLDISAEAAEQHEVTEGKPDSSADHPEKFTGTNIQPKEHTVFLDNLEQNVRTLTVEGVTHNNAGQPTPFLEDETKNEPIILAPTTPNDAVLSIEPPDTHFEEAMTFVDPVDENILTSSLQRPLTKPGVEEVYRNGVGQPITTQDHPRNTSLPYPAQNIFTEETNKNGSFQVARKQDHPVKAAPLSLTAPTSIKKLKDALSSVPQMYTEAKERHEKPGILRKKVLDAPQVSQKRGREPEEATTGKRSRPFLLGDDIHRSRRQPNESPESTPKPVPKSVHRKPNLVHFEPTGPSNQGSSTKLRAASAQQFPAGQALHRVGEHNHKREHIGDVEDDSLELHQRPKKRPKTLHLDSPNRAAEHTPIQLKKSHKIVSIVQQRKPSSQSSRVDAFGSPQPFHHSRTTTLAPSYIAPHLTNEDVTNFDDAWEADENVAPSYDDVSPIPEMLLPPDRPAKAPPRFEPLSIISNNIKHRPSSPLASSSIIDDLTAHKEQPSGQFIDVRTANIIVPQKPQDPFFEATLERPNTFMELLRRSSDQHTRKDQGKQSDQLKFDRVAIAAEDPEKTLIGAQSPDRGDSSSSSSESSPGSDSSTPNGDELSDDENGLWTSSWRNALKSHQISTLEALIEISHRVTQDLVSKEDVIRDMIGDYRKGGEGIVKEYEKARHQEYECDRARQGKVKSELLKRFQDAEKELRGEATGFKKEGADIRSECEERKRKLDANVGALMALGEE